MWGLDGPCRTEKIANVKSSQYPCRGEIWALLRQKFGGPSGMTVPTMLHRFWCDTEMRVAEGGDPYTYINLQTPVYRAAAIFSWGAAAEVNGGARQRKKHCVESQRLCKHILCLGHNAFFLFRYKPAALGFVSSNFVALRIKHYCLREAGRRKNLCEGS